MKNAEEIRREVEADNLDKRVKKVCDNIEELISETMKYSCFKSIKVSIEQDTVNDTTVSHVIDKLREAGYRIMGEGTIWSANTKKQANSYTISWDYGIKH